MSSLLCWRLRFLGGVKGEPELLCKSAYRKRPAVSMVPSYLPAQGLHEGEWLRESQSCFSKWILKPHHITCPISLPQVWAPTEEKRKRHLSLRQGSGNGSASSSPPWQPDVAISSPRKKRTSESNWSSFHLHARLFWRFSFKTLKFALQKYYQTNKGKGTRLGKQLLNYYCAPYLCGEWP